MSSHYEQYTLFLTQKQIQEDAIQFKFISSTSRSAIVVLNEQYKTLWENYAVQEIFQKRSVLQIFKDAQYYDTEIQTTFYDDLKKYINSKQAFQKKFEKIQIKNFQIYGSQDNYQILEIEALNTIWQGQEAIILNILDITEIQKEIQRIENLKQEDKYKDLFLKSLNYEVRGPVQQIQKASQDILQTFDTISKQQNSQEKQQQIDMTSTLDSLKLIYQKSKKLMSVTGQLHEIVQIQAKNIQINYNTFDIKLLLREAFSLIKKDAEKKNLNLVTSIEQNVPKTINSDATKIIYALQNLLYNSVKYTDKGKIVIKVKQVDDFKSQEERQQYDLYKFKVIDTGKGLDVKNFKSNNNQPYQQGFGLGLYISSQIAYVLSERYIEVKSEIDCFSKFSFYVRSKKI